jgi:hypothetical protein
MYLGRLPYWSFHNRDTKLEFKSQKKHIFAYLNKEGYFVEPGFTRILSKVGDDPSPVFADKFFADKFDEYKKSKYGSGPVKLVAAKKSQRSYADFVKDGDKFYYIREHYQYSRYYGSPSKRYNERTEQPVKITPGKSVIVPLETSVKDSISQKNHTVSLCVVNESGKKLNVGEHYYG